MSTRIILLLFGVFVLSITLYILIYYLTGRTIEEHYDNGSIKAVYVYKKGKIEGDYVEYYPNGKVKTKAHFANGVQVDNHISYYENGKMKESYFLKNGKKHGLYQTFYPNSKKKSLGWIKDGYRDSIFTYYSMAESLDSIVLYNKGTVKIRAIYNTEEVNYEDFENHFHLKFLKYWEFDLTQNSGAALLLTNRKGKSIGDFTESLNITLYKPNPKMDINDFVSSYLISMKQDVPSFRSSFVKYIGNRCEISYTATYENRNLEFFLTIVFGKDLTYMITCTADQSNFNIYENPFKQMCNSFSTMIGQQQKNLIAV